MKPIEDAILQMDKDIVILNKPAGLLSVPGLHDKDSAFGRLQAAVGELHIVHRLDMDTSGVIVFARHKAALTHIQQQFEKQTTQKRYQAVVYGIPKGHQGCINLPIRVDWPNRPLQKIAHTDGRYALTRWTKVAIEDGQTRLDLFPKTGRSHQLRLHLQQIGHPIVGDPFYSQNFDIEVTPRMKLHACELEFEHPGTGEKIKASIAPDF